VEVGVAAAVPVLVPVGVGVGVPVGEALGVTAPLREVDAVLLADEPRVREGVGLPDVVLLLERVVDGVGGGVPVLDPVGEEVGVPVPVALAVALPL
jgi:hypothetical protein